MNWHNLYFEEMESANLDRLKRELQSLTKEYIDADKKRRDQIDSRAKQILKEIENIKNAK